MTEDLYLANRLEAFAAYCERFLPGTIRQSECADLRLAAARLVALTVETHKPDDLPETSRASHSSS